jgi:short-subunit dehydrogenase involved in D-alanine esterification of teichoic acids
LNIKENKVVITGGSKGIGLGLAKKFIAEGNKVIVVARSKPENLDFMRSN